MIASHFGARSLVIDGRQLFARDALPALRCNAQYMAMYPISSSLSRPIICRIAVDQAALLGCDAIVHTANQSQNSLRRLNGALHQLGFGGFHGSPYEYSALTRQEKIAELRRAGLTAFQARGTSGDANLWCREFESGTLDNPEAFHVPEESSRGPPGGRASLRHARFPFDSIRERRWQSTTPSSLGRTDRPLERARRRLRHRTLLRPGTSRRRRKGARGSRGTGRAPADECLSPPRNGNARSRTAAGKLSLEQIWVREAIEGRWFADLRQTINQFITHLPAPSPVS